jgi:hypothetical protein
MTRTSALIRFGVVVLTAMFLLGWWMYGNDFRGDTQAHRIQLDVDQVRGASKDDVTEVRLHPVLRGYQLVLLPRLSVGTQVTIYASVAEFGFRRLGGGWIFRGEPFLGRHAVPASVLAVKSSNPGSLEAQLEFTPGLPTRNRIMLRAVRPGMSRISLSVLKLDSAFKPTASEPVSDSLEITVQ